MDDGSFEALSELNEPGMIPIRLGEFEEGDESLLASKATRSQVEYYFTCTPSLPLYVFRKHPEVETITYVDADLFFYSDPDSLFEEIGRGAVSIISHRFPPSLRHMQNAGIYNVGWLTFRKDDRALKVLHWWRERCIEWCYDRFENDLFADQKYLDDWPQRFSGVVELQHKGANLAPWNLSNHQLWLRDSTIMVDGDPLVFFHFHGLKQYRGPIYDLNLVPYGVKPNSIAIDQIYRPYIKRLIAAGEEVASIDGGHLLHRGIRTSQQRPVGGPLVQVQRWWRLARNFAWRRYLVVQK